QRDQQRQQIERQRQQLRQRRDAGEQIDNNEFEKLDQQRRGMMPSLMDWRQIAGDLEKILPPDQVAAGQQRMREQWQQRWQGRRGIDPNSQQDGNNQAADASNNPPPAPGGANSQDQGGERGWGRGRRGGRGFGGPDFGGNSGGPDSG